MMFARVVEKVVLLTRRHCWIWRKSMSPFGQLIRIAFLGSGNRVLIDLNAQTRTRRRRQCTVFIGERFGDDVFRRREKLRVGGVDGPDEVRGRGHQMKLGRGRDASLAG